MSHLKYLLIKDRLLTLGLRVVGLRYPLFGSWLQSSAQGEKPNPLLGLCSHTHLCLLIAIAPCGRCCGDRAGPKRLRHRPFSLVGKCDFVVWLFKYQRITTLVGAFSTPLTLWMKKW